MAFRGLRSKKALCGETEEDLLGDWPCGQATEDEQVVDHPVVEAEEILERNITGGENLRTVGTVELSNKTGGTADTVEQTDLLNMILQALQENRKENERFREETLQILQENRKRDKEENERIRKETLETLQDSIFRNSEVSSEKFRAEINKINESINKRITYENNELKQAVICLEEDTQQQIRSVNKKNRRSE
ncbi:hypothetical protein L798_06500 [Zootermopsis nevadensis]|uniref:Uncharacterized protein n=1 Tax=Zootermopsis nevadensis TaxID=136037 RepID=A0A067RMZ6_ZOONE|nr:hypothetical protein L798_06500 [Zootermopsis nevadensis]